MEYNYKKPSCIYIKDTKNKNYYWCLKIKLDLTTKQNSQEMLIVLASNCIYSLRRYLFYIFSVFLYVFEEIFRTK